MAPNQKIKKACKAMELFPETKVRSVLKTLLKTYDNKWDFIEDEDYKVLLDALLDEADAQVCFLINVHAFEFICLIFSYSYSVTLFLDFSYGRPLKTRRRQRKRSPKYVHFS